MHGQVSHPFDYHMHVTRFGSTLCACVCGSGPTMGARAVQNIRIGEQLLASFAYQLCFGH